jgi:hypothetical protein
MADAFLRLSAKDRCDALGVAADRSGRPAHLLEKDVWAVWALAALYGSPLGEHLVFKGGTSLSKAYRVIRRFSEDVDLTYDIRVIAPDLVGDGDEALSISPGASCWQRIRAATEQGQIVRIGVDPAALPSRGLAHVVDLGEVFQRRAGGRERDGEFFGDSLDGDDRAGLHQFVDAERGWGRATEACDLLSVSIEHGDEIARGRGGLFSGLRDAGQKELHPGLPDPSLADLLQEPVIIVAPGHGQKGCSGYSTGRRRRSTQTPRKTGHGNAEGGT